LQRLDCIHTGRLDAGVSGPLTVARYAARMIWGRIIVIALGIAGFNTSAPSHAARIAETEVQGAGSAMEGDVVSVKGTMVRLRGIDAPDPGQICRTLRGVEYDCFSAARAQLQQMLDLGEVTCVAKEQDRNQHHIGVCRVLGKDLSAAMLVRGWAFAYRSLSTAYGGLEARAQARKAGMWAGRVEAPWLWRTRKLNE
jgi:endonuclease YncB( thermonuclease family)